ncbi:MULTISPECIES: histone deacetylase family protein [Sphingomonas]|uniref:histone deacetylase family protein n=1 Tax=Sphingomonas TaxID=13687 RepID=UPI002413649B|nr:histone deacetylase [Sphingomonas echinoides]
MIPVVHHPAYVASGQANNPSQLSKNAAIRNRLEAEGAGVAWHVPEAMPVRWLEAVHDAEYVAEVLNARVPREKERRIGFAVTESVAARAAVVPGGTWLAGKLALETGFAANTAGGSHHALAATGAGYCVFNDLAIAAVRLSEEDGLRVLVVDCDVHQGDGTAALTAGYPGIATYSIHAEKNFPARKARSTLDVALPDATDDPRYLETLEATLVPLLDELRPQIILYQAGIDPLLNDRLGRLALTDAGLVARETLVARLAIERQIPLASTVGGGYGADTVALAERHVRAILTLGAAFAGAA